jgi:hypothetical protein
MSRSPTRRKSASHKSARRPKPRAKKRAKTRAKIKRAKIGQIFTGDQALHALFQEQAAAILDDADVGEEEKQSILLAMSCPCCGAGSMSFSVKMRPKGKFVAEES